MDRKKGWTEELECLESGAAGEKVGAMRTEDFHQRLETTVVEPFR